MRRVIPVLLAFGVLASPVTAQVPAQGANVIPTFAGEWKLEPERSSSTGGGRGVVDTPGGGRGGGLGLGPSPDALLITQDTRLLRVEELRGRDKSSVAFRLDGMPEVRALSAGRNSGLRVTTTSRWRDGRLITTFTLPASAEGGAVTYEETRWLEPDGGMVVETRRRDAPNVRRALYRRVTR